MDWYAASASICSREYCLSPNLRTTGSSANASITICILSVFLQQGASFKSSKIPVHQPNNFGIGNPPMRGSLMSVPPCLPPPLASFVLRGFNPGTKSSGSVIIFLSVSFLMRYSGEALIRTNSFSNFSMPTKPLYFERLYLNLPFLTTRMTARPRGSRPRALTWMSLTEKMAPRGGCLEGVAAR